MEQNIVIQPVGGDGVIDIVILVGIPVLRQLLRTQNKHRLIAVFIVFDNSQRGEGLAQTDAVGKNTAVIFFELVDDGKHSVTLEVIEHTPDFALLEAGRLVGQHIFRNVLQKFIEHIEQRNEVNQFRRVFIVGCGDVINHNIGHVLQETPVTPHRFKQFEELQRVFKTVQTGDHVIAVVSALTADIHSRKAVEGLIHILLLLVVNGHEAIRHRISRCVGFEAGFPPDPVGTLFGNGFLRHLIPQLDFKFRSVNISLTGQARNVKFPFLLALLFGDKCRRSKDEPEFIHFFQLCFQFMVGIHGKTSRRNRYLTAFPYRFDQIIPHLIGDVVKDSHSFTFLNHRNLLFRHTLTLIISHNQASTRFYLQILG